LGQTLALTTTGNHYHPQRYSQSWRGCC